MELLLLPKISKNLPRIDEAARLSRVPLSMDAIRRAMPGCIVCMYDDIPNMPLNEWLGSVPDKSAIILYRWSGEYGHYIAACLQSSGDIQLFDSTGHGPDDLRSLQTEEKAAGLGQERRRLLADIRQMEKGTGAFYQDRAVQGKGAETCGRWCALRVVFRDFSEDNFTDAFNNLSVKLNIPIDILATLVTI